MSSKYDIRAIFEKMELDLISSMHRNLKYHESEEDKEGFKWEQWQKSKLRALNKYRQENKLILDKYINSIEENVNKELQSNFNKGLSRIANVINKLKSLFIKNKSTNNPINKSENDVQRFNDYIKNIKLTTNSTLGIQVSMVTSGGVSVKEINSSTMESKVIKDLYFTGEVVDVDAETGGYNLQIAFSTGYLAGISIE